MALKDYQVEIESDTLYGIQALGGVSGVGAQVSPNIEIVGTGSIYTSQIEPDSAPTGMYLTQEGFTGILEMNIIPNYIYVTDATNIILTGVEATEV